MNRILQILIVLVVIDCGAFAALWYGNDLMQQKKTDETALRAELLSEGQKGEKINALRHALNLAEADHKALEQYLFDPGEESQIQFLSRMEQLGMQTTGALIETHTIDASGGKVHAEFAVTGTWAQVYQVLRLIEEMPTHVLINQWSIQQIASPDATKESPDHWTGSLSMDIVSLKS